MRLFVAVDIPGPSKEALERGVVARLRGALPSARWSRPDGRHLTLKFLGEVSDERVEAVEAAVASAVEGRGRFEAGFEGVGGFPNLRRPRVLWVGMSRGIDAMAALAGRLDDALSPLGFEPERRAFNPHLTLARFKVPGPIGQLPPVDVPAEPFSVDEVVLFRSQLRRDGAVYTAHRRYPL